jgi:hypothetical protein
MAIGKGISEAVRQTVLEWLDSETIKKIAAEANKALKTERIWTTDMMDEKAWVRKVRRGDGVGFTRTYRCNGLPSAANVELEVRSNKPDTRINYYAFKVNGKFVAGGFSDVASVNVSSDRPNVAKVGATAAHGNVLSTPSGIQTKVGSFRRLSETELQKLNIQAEFSVEETFDRLFEDRDA